MATRFSLTVAPAALICALLAAGCGAASAPASTGTASATVLATPASATPGTPPTVVPSGTPIAAATPKVSASTTAVADPCEVDEDFGELPASATCSTSFINADQPTPPFAQYTIPAAGWRAFNGTFKDVETDDGVQRVGALFVSISNLTIDACKQQRQAEPPIGPTVDDLAAGLAALSPFEVTSPPADVTAFGYAGKHLEIRVPLDQPSDGFERFTGCGGQLLKSWIAPGHVSFAFNGYTAPGDTEEFWILDHDGERLVVVALTTANASAELVAERQAVLDSVVITP